MVKINRDQSFVILDRYTKNNQRYSNISKDDEHTKGMLIPTSKYHVRLDPIHSYDVQISN